MIVAATLAVAGCGKDSGQRGLAGFAEWFCPDRRARADRVGSSGSSGSCGSTGSTAGMPRLEVAAARQSGSGRTSSGGSSSSGAGTCRAAVRRRRARAAGEWRPSRRRSSGGGSGGGSPIGRLLVAVRLFIGRGRFDKFSFARFELGRPAGRHRDERQRHVGQSERLGFRCGGRRVARAVRARRARTAGASVPRATPPATNGGRQRRHDRAVRWRLRHRRRILGQRGWRCSRAVVRWAAPRRPTSVAVRSIGGSTKRSARSIKKSARSRRRMRRSATPGTPRMPALAARRPAARTRRRMATSPAPRAPKAPAKAIARAAPAI